MAESSKTKASWFSLIDDSILGRVATSSVSEGGDYAQQGNSICTSRREALPETLPPRTNNGRTTYNPDPQMLRNAGYTEDEIRDRVGGRA
jgi:hypothetical protein